MYAAHAPETRPATRNAHNTGCSGCAHAATCQAGGYGEATLSGLRDIVERVGLLRDGEYLYRPRTPFRALYAVQSGMAKTVAVDSSGREQVLAFHLPGELFALDAICLGHHDNAVIALGRTQFCRFPFDRLRCLTTTQPDVQWHLMHTMSRQIHQQRLSGGDYPAEERMAAFLTNLSDRRTLLGLRTDHLPLPMSRADIGNHLRLATETVSRLLARFRDARLIRVERQGIEVLNGKGLREIGRHLLQA
ncbi:CRP/FNR family transcriptional regulator, anaerobic regulatory protein [Dyella sp. OK004]|uniref:helix-turn-helix domain-containing protein n=1 Tax=Dyella sp. OK004 TaxID=1855292 RepID=UPI0008DF2C8C|nr:helix-turn-helix domain-containing protein [Dyella sp. OK004]SFR99946.1 CRP/FNR family transcriptional regulator, anaerobic regulatory protein [Dyella sp. OK004]